MFDRHERTLTDARAGHPPPLIVYRDGVACLDHAGGALLTIDSGRRRTIAVVDVDDGDVLVLYTDGLIERRGESFDIGFERLAVATNELYGDTVQRIADDLIRVLPETIRDDVVIVVAQLRQHQRQPDWLVTICCDLVAHAVNPFARHRG